WQDTAGGELGDLDLGQVGHAGDVLDHGVGQGADAVVVDQVDDALNAVVDEVFEAGPDPADGVAHVLERSPCGVRGEAEVVEDRLDRVPRRLDGATPQPPEDLADPADRAHQHGEDRHDHALDRGTEHADQQPGQRGHDRHQHL